MGAGKGEDDDGSHGGQGGQDEEASLRTGETTGEDGSADRVSGEEVALDHGAGVGYTVEEGLGPIPRGVEAERPPEGAGAIEGKAEDEAGGSGGEEAERGLARVGAVTETEDEREDKRGRPEAERVAVAGVEEDAVDAGQAAGEGVLEVAAEERFLPEGYEGEADGPDGGEAEGLRGREEAGIEGEEAADVQDGDEGGEADDPPGEALEELGEARDATEAKGGEAATLHAASEKGGGENDGEGGGLAQEHGLGRGGLVRGRPG